MVSAIARVIALSSLVLSVAACSGDDPAGSTPPDASAPLLNEDAAALVPADIKAKGTITIASAASNAPMEFLDADGETLIGFDIDFSDAIAASLGLEAEHVASTFDAIIPGLAAGRYDAGISGFFVTEEREQVVDFVPYLRDGSALVVQSGNPLGLSMDDSMGLCGHRVAGEKGSVQGLEYLPAMSEDCDAAGEQPITVMLFPTLDEAHLALTGDRADAIMEDSVPSGYRAARSDGKYEVAPGEVYQPVLTGIAFPKNSELKPAVEAAVKALAEDGTLEQLMDEWSIPSTALLPSYN